MGKISYTLGRIKKMRFNAAFDTVKRVSLRSGKPRAFVLLDIVWCGLRYSAGYMDYDVFKMERTNGKQRKTFITRGVNNNFVKMLNDVNYRHYFQNKDEFNTAFSDFIGREWMLVHAGKGKEFEVWLGDKTVVIAKPRAGMCGKGIQKLYTKDFANTAELFEYILHSDCELAEECLLQHPHLNEMYPHSINTTRIVTVYKDGKTKVICAYLRIGNGGRHVDNFNSGGMITRVDIETGKLMFVAVDKAGITYSEHPETLTAIKGFEIPRWSSCLDLALRAAAVIPQIGLVGWDIAVTPNGPVIVEGNEFPGHDIYQMPPHTPDNYGLLPLFNEAIYGKK